MGGCASQEDGRFERVGPLMTGGQHIVVELRHNGPYAEINGKNVDGIFEAITAYYSETLGATVWDWQDKEPFCDLKLVLGKLFMRWRGGQGENDLGQQQAKLFNFMSEKGWELTTRQNYTYTFSKRAEEVPPAQYLVLELRHAGPYVELSGPNVDGIHQVLSDDFQQRFNASVWDWKGEEPFCDLKLKVGKQFLRWRGGQGENDFGQVQARLFDFMSEKGWHVVDFEKATFIFVKRPERISQHLVLELRNIGPYVELNGQNVGGIHNVLATYFGENFGGTAWDWKGEEPFCDLKLQLARVSGPGYSMFRQRGTQGESDLGQVQVRLLDFLSEKGWDVVDRQAMYFFFSKRPDCVPPSRHLVLEHREAGPYVELNGENVDGIHDALGVFYRELIEATEWTWKGEEPFCDKKFLAAKLFRRMRGVEGENDQGKMCVLLFDYMAEKGWVLRVQEDGTFIFAKQQRCRTDSEAAAVE